MKQNKSHLPRRIRKLLGLAILALPLSSFAHGIAEAPHATNVVPDAPEPLTLDGLVKAFGWDFDKSEIKSQQITDNLFVLFGVGGNVAVSIGDDGVLVVDDQFPEMIPKIKKEISKLGGKQVDFAINTHWHFDHAEGNLALGPDGTWIVAQENSREMMQGDHLVNLVLASYMQKAYPEAALPDITFKDTMKMHVNGEEIALMHFGAAHTTGDTAIYFKTSNAVHLGDVFNNAGYPFIDAGNGGSLSGVIEFCSQTLAQIKEDTIVIPGHGAVSDYATLKAYIAMLSEIRTAMKQAMADGKTLDEVYQLGITKKWDKQYGDATGFLNRAYLSLSRETSH